MEQLNWHTKTTEQVFAQLRVTPESGLSEIEVQRRQKEFGLNRIPEPKGKSLFSIFISQFLSPLIYVLVGACVISIAANELKDAAFIFAIIFINAMLGTYQEWRAEHSAAALKNMIKVNARVKRAGKLYTVESEQLVPGDCVLLESGMKVPADLRLFDVNELTVDEGLLTGESAAVAKEVAVLKDETISIGDQINMAFASTTVQIGRAMGIVVATGEGTEIGKIAASLKTSEPEKPPLVKRMESFSKKISWAVIVVCVLLGMIGIWQDTPLAELFFFLVAVGVSAIPEGLPVALTVALSIGTRNMARKNVIVRKLPAVEGLGSCTLVASDKTGTLTLDQQTARAILLPDRQLLLLDGQGYNGVGTIRNADNMPASADNPALQRLIQCSLVCNEGALRKVEGGWEKSGDAVDVALLAIAYKAGHSPSYYLHGTTLKQLIPYESEKKYSGAYFEENGSNFFTCKGAFEVIGPRLEEHFRQQAMSDVKMLAQQGYRVLCIAYCESGGSTTEEDLPPLRMAGLIGLIDPVRPEVPDAVRRCHAAGIEVAMVTGDHPITALAIARELGIAQSENQLISGKELAELKRQESETAWLESMKSKRVFARVSPLQKMEIVGAMKKNGHFVAVTGDGANDAPALRMAHIGIAMGSGTDLTKESSSIIIADNNFASIVAGVEEGRITYNNLRKIIYMLLSTGLAEILTVALAMVFQMPLPFLAIQLLWLNLVTNGIQDISLAFERSNRDVLNKPPRSPGEPIFDSRMLSQIFVSGLATTFLCFGVWYYSLNVLNLPIIQSRTIVLMLMVLVQNFHVLNCRSETTSLFKLPVSANYVAVISIFLAQALHVSASYIPFLAETLTIAIIPWKNWLVLLLLSSLIVVVMEVYKILAFQRTSLNEPISR